MQADVDFTNFSRGEGSPKLKGRTDYAGYFDMAETELNFVSMPQGGATRRPGTLLSAAAKTQTAALFQERMIPFIFSTIQAYMLEFCAGFFRVYMNDFPVLNLGVPVDVAVPYSAADLAAIEYIQSADTLYLCHPNYPTQVVTRSSHTSWSVASFGSLDGPYLDVNATSTTLTPSAASGAITLTASSTVGINPTRPSDPTTGQGFLAGDVGRHVRIKVSAKWAWCIITAITSTTVVSATVQAAILAPAGGNYVDGALDGTTATVNWRLGKWSTTTGFPYVPMFWQNRLALCGTNNQPNAVEASCTGAFTTFSPTLDDGTTVATNALSWIISDDQVNAIRALSPSGSSAAMQLGIFTTGGEEILTQANLSAALSPTNVQVYRETSYGNAANVRPLRIGKAVLLGDRPGRKLREWQWAWAVNGFLGPELTVDSEHITRPIPASLQGIAELAYQQSPHSVVWARRGDGQLIGFTYLPEQKVLAWHRHILGGQYYGGPPIVESIATIPSPDGSYDELWMVVVRTIAGVFTRTVEVMTRYFDGQPQDQAWFVDCAVQSALTTPAAILTPTGFTNSATGVGDPPAFTGSGTFAASAAVFAGTSADVGKVIRTNNGAAVVTAAIDTQHVTATVLFPLFSLAPAAANAWSCTAANTTFSGLALLNGETVQILGDGADYGTQVVAGGAITLPNGGAAALVTAGLPYVGDLITMPYSPRQAAMSVAGKERRIDHVYVRVDQSLGFNYGQKRTDPMTGIVDHPSDALETRNAGNPLGVAPPLMSGIVKLPLPGGYDREGQIEIWTSGPFPLTVLAIGAATDVSGLAA